MGEDIAATTDIRLPLERLKFSVRAALLCVRDGELLVQTSGGQGELSVIVPTRLWRITVRSTVLF